MCRWQTECNILISITMAAADNGPLHIASVCSMQHYICTAHLPKVANLSFFHTIYFLLMHKRHYLKYLNVGNAQGFCERKFIFLKLNWNVINLFIFRALSSMLQDSAGWRKRQIVGKIEFITRFVSYSRYILIKIYNYTCKNLFR